MSGSTLAAGGELRARILLDPDLILADPAVMRALVERTDRAGRACGGGEGKVVDLRSVAMARLEARLGRLEAAHRTVIAAAYENLAGTQQVHRAILRLLEARSLGGFVEGLTGEVAGILRLDAVRLVVEGAEGDVPLGAPAPIPLRPLPTAANDAGPPSAGAAAASAAGLKVVPPGWISGRVACGGPSRVVLRRGAVLLAEGGGTDAVPAGSIGSEAWLALDLGEGRRPGLVVLGSGDPDQFAPGQGTELLEFLAGVLERALRRWLA